MRFFNHFCLFDYVDTALAGNKRQKNNNEDYKVVRKVWVLFTFNLFAFLTEFK